ncbi:hypothetical protein AVEN_228148-1 [Araneus ventricosus]|uniref:Uncharacterized protein n=1 Tax=Araneus ventricosus TaxID=182803 RepID=A0A4Y2CWJ8_ARAVE|nr:hypothetical protein AVEN_228148-1 [Araneus ventricosus]
MKRIHGDLNDDCEYQCRDVVLIFYCPVYGNCSFLLVKDRDGKGYSQLSANETSQPSLRGNWEQACKQYREDKKYYDWMQLFSTSFEGIQCLFMDIIRLVSVIVEHLLRTEI